LINQTPERPGKPKKPLIHGRIRENGPGTASADQSLPEGRMPLS
jgi:hypothetical protein